VYWILISIVASQISLVILRYGQRNECMHKETGFCLASAPRISANISIRAADTWCSHVKPVSSCVPVLTSKSKEVWGIDGTRIQLYIIAIVSQLLCVKWTTKHFGISEVGAGSGLLRRHHTRRRCSWLAVCLEDCIRFEATSANSVSQWTAQSVKSSVTWCQQSILFRKCCLSASDWQVYTAILFGSSLSAGQRDSVASC